MVDLIQFLAPIAQQYRLDPAHTHGLSHWARVLENGLRLAELEGGDTAVIHLFAIFHDACRRNQSIDPGHGTRGAALAETLLGDLRVVTRQQLDLLVEACRDHTDGKTAADLTVQICWDSDRLDLARVAIMPNPAYLCTGAARSASILSWANQRAQANFTPPYVVDHWLPYFIQR